VNKFLLRVLNKFNLLEKLNLVGTISLNNRNFKIPVLGKTGFLNMWMTEPWMIKLLELVVPLSKGVFIDVGVNTGQTLVKLKSVNSQVDYIGFEPNPTCIYYVNELIRLNEFKNISLIPVGLSNESQIGKLIFFDTSSTDSSASIVEDFRPDHKIAKTEFIPIFNMATIRQYLQISKIGIVKIDVEGGELEVLQGMEHEIISGQPIILLEILPAYDKENSNRIKRQHEVEKLFSNWGYSIFRIIKNNDQLVSLEVINEIGIHGNLNACEYVVVPGILNEEFLKLKQNLTL
jgi:FkbM family methyltransferase